MPLYYRERVFYVLDCINALRETAYNDSFGICPRHYIPTDKTIYNEILPADNTGYNFARSFESQFNKIMKKLAQEYKIFEIIKWPWEPEEDPPPFFVSKDGFGYFIIKLNPTFEDFYERYANGLKAGVPYPHKFEKPEVEKMESKGLETEQHADSSDNGDAGKNASINPILNSNSFKQVGKQWRIIYECKEVIMPDSKGMTYIRHLLLHPNMDISALSLQGLRDKPPPPANGIKVNVQFYSRKDELLDSRAIREIAHRMSKLSEGSPEHQKLQNHLKRSTFGGKSKGFTDGNEKVRTAVTNAISRTITAIRKHDSTLATHLDNCIQSGKECRYNPDKTTSWK